MTGAAAAEYPSKGVPANALQAQECADDRTTYRAVALTAGAPDAYWTDEVHFAMARPMRRLPMAGTTRR